MEDTLNLNGQQIFAQMRRIENEKYSVHRVLLSRKVVVPPNTEIIAQAQLSNPSTKQVLIRGPEM